MAAILHVIFDFYELKNTLFFKKSKLTQIYYYEPQSAEMNVQSPQSESTPRRLTLTLPLKIVRSKIKSNPFLRVSTYYQ